MTVRKATLIDIDSIEKIYNDIITVEENRQKTVGWKRGIYPIRSTAEKALERDDLFVLLEQGEVVASAIINKVQVPEYINGEWQFVAEDDDVMCLHTLVVAPKHFGKGYATRFVRFYEDYAKENGCHYLRMDTNALNYPAQKLYFKLGYNPAGVVQCSFNGLDGTNLLCLEKKL